MSQNKDKLNEIREKLKVNEEQWLDFNPPETIPTPEYKRKKYEHDLELIKLELQLLQLELQLERQSFKEFKDTILEGAKQQ